MTPPAIRIKNLSKNFRDWKDRPNSLKTLLVNLTRGKFDLGEGAKEISCLSNINFEINRGEFVGIMGRNGAGKSTLMKLICGIYSPTAGSVEINGTIAPLIELGAGFHGDLSGYENIFLNAAVLGFGRVATLKAVPQILDFADLGDKIYMPVKNYSSGMLVRLGFSIATHLEAPILLVDEVLAVGDVGFQEKCLRKIYDLHQAGRTIVLITHSMESVLNHCKRCIVLADSQVVYDGPSEQGVQIYRKSTGI